MLRIIAASLLLMTTPFDFARAEYDRPWLIELERQVESELGCDVAWFLNAREFRLAGKEVQEARVTCMDRRQFDASRTEPDEVFTLRDCTPVVC